MHLGIFMELGRRKGGSQADAFQEGFALVDAAERWGLDAAWLAEIRFNLARSVLSFPNCVPLVNRSNSPQYSPTCQGGEPV